MRLGLLFSSHVTDEELSLCGRLNNVPKITELVRAGAEFEPRALELGHTACRPMSSFVQNEATGARAETF